MLDKALKFLKMLEDNGYQAYIVGGFVRDYLLGIESSDIDICTNARPSDIREIFKDSCLPNEDYGSVVVNTKNLRCEVTTFRREISYVNNRKPVEYVYIDDLLEDLKRRDFTINTICMNKNGEIIDLLDGQSDLKKGEINTVGDSVFKFSEDSLRILRAIRFATILNFKLSDDVKNAIMETKYLLKNLSYERKKQELDKIFSSIHVKYGVKLLIELGLDYELELYNLKDIKNFDNLIGTWAQLNVSEIYPFTKNEKEMIKDILEAIKLDNLDPLVLYKYGLYVNTIAGDIKGIDRKLIISKYDKLAIKDKNEIAITGNDIMEILNRKPGVYLKAIFSELEMKIVLGKLDNNLEVLKEYIINNYK